MLVHRSTKCCNQNYFVWVWKGHGIESLALKEKWVRYPHFLFFLVFLLLFLCPLSRMWRSPVRSDACRHSTFTRMERRWANFYMLKPTQKEKRWIACHRSGCILAEPFTKLSCLHSHFTVIIDLFLLQIEEFSGANQTKLEELVKSLKWSLNININKLDSNTLQPIP